MTRHFPIVGQPPDCPDQRFDGLARERDLPGMIAILALPPQICNHRLRLAFDQQMSTFTSERQVGLHIARLHLVE